MKAEQMLDQGAVIRVDQAFRLLIRSSFAPAVLGERLDRIVAEAPGAAAWRPLTWAGAHTAAWILADSEPTLSWLVERLAADLGDRLLQCTDPVLAAAEHGKTRLVATVPLRTADDLAVAYTPGVGRVALRIAHNPAMTDEFTGRRNRVAIVTDRTAVLGLGNLGPGAALPVMEGKAALFAALAGIDAVPLCLQTTDADAIVNTVCALAPSFGGVNLEDISAPRCFSIARRLQEALLIPVFHDDQHGTAIVVLAALQNALRVVGKRLDTARVVVVGAGAAGTAVSRLLLTAGARHLVVWTPAGSFIPDFAGCPLTSCGWPSTPIRRAASVGFPKPRRCRRGHRRERGRSPAAT